MDYQTIPEQSEPKLLARWESRGGKYWINLYFNPCFHLANGTDVVDAHYRGDGMVRRFLAMQHISNSSYLESKRP